MSEHGAENDVPRTRFGPWVQGNCPTCGVASLFVGAGGYLTCGDLQCSRPEAPSEVLGIEFPARVAPPAGGDT